MEAMGHWGCGVRVGWSSWLLWLFGTAAGTPPDLWPAHTGLFQEMVQSQRHFINVTDCGGFVERNISNQEQFLHLGSHVGLYVGTPPLGTRLPGTGTATRNEWSTDELQWTGTAGTTPSCPARSLWSAEVSVGQSVSPRALPWE